MLPLPPPGCASLGTEDTTARHGFGDLLRSVPAYAVSRGPSPLTCSSLWRPRRCTSQSGSRSLSPRWRWRSKTRGSDSFSLSASCARFPDGKREKRRERSRRNGSKKKGSLCSLVNQITKNCHIANSADTFLKSQHKQLKPPSVRY